MPATASTTRRSPAPAIVPGDHLETQVRLVALEGG
jgi:hypothetical protein